jgi:hypothetical protein
MEFHLIPFMLQTAISAMNYITASSAYSICSFTKDIILQKIQKSTCPGITACHSMFPSECTLISLAQCLSIEGQKEKKG